MKLQSNEVLFTCPRCARTGFYSLGLRKHICRGSHPDDKRRQLTQDELAEAAAVAARAIAVANPGNPQCLRHFVP